VNGVLVSAYQALVIRTVTPTLERATNQLVMPPHDRTPGLQHGGNIWHHYGSQATWVRPISNLATTALEPFVPNVADDTGALRGMSRTSAACSRIAVLRRCGAVYPNHECRVNDAGTRLDCRSAKPRALLPLPVSAHRRRNQ
jgi:hypothetical protein